VFAALVWLGEVSLASCILFFFFFTKKSVHVYVVSGELFADFGQCLVNFHTYKVVESIDDCKKKFKLFLSTDFVNVTPTSRGQTHPTASDSNCCARIATNESFDFLDDRFVVFFIFHVMSIAYTLGQRLSNPKKSETFFWGEVGIVLELVFS